MKTFILLLSVLLFSPLSESAIHEYLMGFVDNSEYVNDLKATILSKDNLEVSCEAINLRINKYIQSEGDIEEYQAFLSAPATYKQKKYKEIVAYLMSEQREFYDIFIDTFELETKIPIDHINVNNTFIFLIHSGQSKEYFSEDLKHFDFKNGSLIVHASNFEVCIDTKIDLFIVEDCNVESFGQLNNCLRNDVRHYEVTIPQKQFVNFRAGGWR